MTRPKIRLYVDQPLGSEQSVALTREQAHYLFGVMRLGEGHEIAVFNGQEGEWRAKVIGARKRTGVLICKAQTAPQVFPPDLWLFFAPIKKARTDFIVEKAVEMGVAKICPIQTQFTNSDRIRQDRLQAHAVEAAEQCGATFVPKVEALVSLEKTLLNWQDRRKLLFCDEGLVGKATELTSQPSAPWAIIIGPEGGFSENERNQIVTMPQSVPISLGPRILRADTAAVAALTVWQMLIGDWR